jgi:hypothetical protein
VMAAASSSVKSVLRDPVFVSFIAILVPILPSSPVGFVAIAVEHRFVGRYLRNAILPDSPQADGRNPSGELNLCLLERHLFGRCVNAPNVFVVAMLPVLSEYFPNHVSNHDS